MGEHSSNLSMRAQQGALIRDALFEGSLDRLLADGQDWTQALSPRQDAGWIGFAVRNASSIVHKVDEEVRLLIEHGFPLDQKNDKGETPLMLAFSSIRPNVARALLEAGADVNAVDNDGWSILMRLSSRPPSYSTSMDEIYASMIRLAIQAGADPNYQSPHSRNCPLRLAARSGLAHVCQVLLEAGARPDIRDSQGKRPSQVARDSGFERCARLIEDYERRIDAQVDLQVETPQASAPGRRRRI